MRKKKNRIIRILSLLLALVLLSIPASAIAQESGQTTTDIKQMIFLEDGNKIVITNITVASTRGTTVTRGRMAEYTNSKDEVLCSFALYGIFDISTRRCVDTSHIISGPHGTWRVEDAKTWHDSYKAYGSAKFVQRVLGVKLDSESISLELSY